MRRWHLGAALAAFAFAALGAGSASAAPVGDDPCLTKVKTVKAVNQTASSTLVAGTIPTKPVICSFALMVTLGNTATVLMGTGALCVGGQSPVTGPIGDTAVTQTLSSGPDLNATAFANNYGICIVQTGTGQVSGFVSYVLITP